MLNCVEQRQEKVGHIFTDRNKRKTGRVLSKKHGIITIGLYVLEVRGKYL